MGHIIKVRRGMKATIPSSAGAGEPLYTMDTKEFFVGNGDGQPLSPIGGTKVGSTGSQDYLNEDYFEQDVTNHIRLKLNALLVDVDVDLLDGKHASDFALTGHNHTGVYEPTLTKGNLTESTSSVLTVTGGTGAVIGSGATIQVKEASTTQSGYLSSTDWNTFNGKQNALGYTPENVANKGSASGYAGLDSTGKLAQNVDAGKITTGTIDVARLPAGALERLFVVDDQVARYALQPEVVQNGDTVKQDDTGVMYYVKDNANLSNANGYELYAAGTAAAVEWAGILSKPNSLSGYGITDGVNTSEVVTTATANKILKLNGSAKLPASITGDADTVDGYHAGTSASTLLVLDANGLTPLGNIPATLTGKDADTVDGKHANDFALSGHNHAGVYEPVFTKGNIGETTSSVLTVTGGTGAIIGTGVTIQVKKAGGLQDGYLSSTDWNTFNNKQDALGYTPVPPTRTINGEALSADITLTAAEVGAEPTLTKGDLQESTSGVLTITGGTNAVIGSGTTIQVKVAGSAQSGYLSSGDWNTFNNKLNASAYTANDVLAKIITVDGNGSALDADKLDGIHAGNSSGEIPISNSSVNVDLNADLLDGNHAAAFSLTSHTHSGIYQPTFTTGNLAETASTILTITGGTGAVIGSGATIQVKQASTSQSGYLSNTDWNTFNGKQNALGFTPENSANKGAISGYASLDVNQKLVQNVDASKITSGTIDIARLPTGALERLVVVADQAARYALTTANVQTGDTVKQTDTGVMYFVVDDANLGNASGYSVYTAGSATSVPWSGVTSTPTSLSGYGITDAISTSGGTITGNLTATTFTSNQATGTAPFTVASTTGVSNLNADMLDDHHFADLKYYHGISSRPVGATNPIPTTITTTTFTLNTGTYPVTYWYQGTKVIVNVNKSATLDDGAGGSTAGLYHVYFNGITGNILATKSFPGVSSTSNVYIASVTWNGSNYGLVNDERHGNGRNTEWHQWAHNTIGTRYRNGITLTHNGGTGAAATFATTSGEIWDEDIQFSVPASSAFPTVNACRLFWQNGANSYTFDSAVSTVPFKRGVNNRPVYIDPSYTVVEMTSAVNRYINVFVYVTTDLHTPIYMIAETVDSTVASTNGHTNLTNARAVEFPNISNMGISVEMRPIYRLIVRADGQVQAIDATLDDYRAVSSLPQGAGTVSTSASTVSANPTGWLTSGTVQGQLDEVGALTITQSSSGSSTDNAIARFDLTSGKLIQNSLATIDDAGSVNIPIGQTYKINGTALTAANVGAEPTLTKGNLTEATSSVLTITGGTGAIIGSGLTVQVKQATTSVSGYLSNTDWNTFNNKEPAITKLTAFNRDFETSTTNIKMNGAVSVGVLNTIARADHIHATDTSREPTLTKGNLTEATSSVLTITGGTGAVIGSGLTVQVKQATTSVSGYLSSTDWNTFNSKQAALTLGNLAETTSSVLTITGGTGAVVGGATIQVKQAATAQSGYLTSTDWNTFNNKEPAVTKGNLTEATSSVLTITGGTGAVIGSGLTVQVKAANTSQSGYLTFTDWNTFNGKQAALGYVPVNKAGDSMSGVLTSTVVTGTAPFTIASTTVVSNLNADLHDGLHTATASTASTVAARDASGNLTAKQLVSDIAQGTAPLTVVSNTVVTSLNADLLDGYNASGPSTASTVAARDSSGNLTAKQLISDVAQGTAPLAVTSTTVVPNLNVALHNGYTVALSSTASTMPARDGSGNITAKSFVSDVAQGTAPLTVTSTTKVTNLNVDAVDGCTVNDAGTTTSDLWTASKIQTAINSVVGANDAMIFKGVLDCSTSPNYPAADAGWTYKVSVAGKIGGASGRNVEIGDTIYCTVDATASGTQAVVGANWNIIQVNIDGSVTTAETSSVDGQIVLESGTSGRLIKKSLATVDSAGSVNIPAGQTYKINGTALTAANVGAEPTLTKGNLTEATSAVLTITGGSSAVIGSGLTIQVKQATGTVSGYLSSTDWTTFNSKQNALTLGNLTEATSSVLTITGGTGAVVGGATIQVKQATTTVSGYLSSTDWNTFNGKEPAITKNTAFNPNFETTASNIKMNGAVSVGALSTVARADHIHATDTSREPTVTKGNLTESTSAVLTITGGTAAVIGSGLTIQVKQATTAVSGYLSSTDWNTFNGKEAAIGTKLTGFNRDFETATANIKMNGAVSVGVLNTIARADHIHATDTSREPTLTKGNLTEATSSVLTITGGSGAIIGSGLTVQVKQATTSVSGYLSSTDWTTFNGKQNALGYTPVNKAGDSMSGVLTSTVVTGTAPFTIASTTLVSNLNADLLDGQQGSYYSAWANITGKPTTVSGYGITDAIPFSTLTATTAATAQWYRIATSAVNIGANSATFKVDFSGTGVKGRAFFLASCHDGSTNGSNIVQLGYTSSNLTLGLTQIRVVYHTTPTANYAYVEVYNPTALAITYVVDLIDSTGWSLLTPSTVGSIPVGYTSESIICDVGLVSREDITAGNQLISLIATGTAPLSVASTTLVSNLNADLLDGLQSATAATVSTVAARDASGDLTARRFVSGLATGTSPLSVTSTTVNTNLNADLLDGLHTATASTVSTVAARDASGNLTVKSLISDVAVGTAPLTVTSTTKVTNLNADTLDGAHLDDTTTTTSNIWSASKVNSVVGGVSGVTQASFDEFKRHLRCGGI